MTESSAKTEVAKQHDAPPDMESRTPEDVLMYIKRLTTTIIELVHVRTRLYEDIKCLTTTIIELVHVRTRLYEEIEYLRNK